MWETSIIGVLSFFFFFPFPGSVNAQCKLATATYMPFLVRVMNKAGQGKMITTGSIITPISVLTTCIELIDLAPNNLRASACQSHYSVGSVDENHFKQASDQEDKKGCIQSRDVKTKRNHPRCPSRGDPIYSEDYTRYNLAVLVVNSAFTNWTEAVPTLPFISDIGTQLALIDTFNTIRTERCEIPLYSGTKATAHYLKDMSFRSMALQLECKDHICKGLPAQCNVTVANSTAFILCARRVRQPVKGITWTDYLSEDKDYYTDNEDQCKDLKHTVGSPLMCRGAAVGIVTQCNSYGMVISSIFTLRVLLHSLVDEGYTEEVIYMDVSEVPTRRPRAAFYSQGFEETQISEELRYSNSNPVHQDFLEGLALFTVNVIFLLVN